MAALVAVGANDAFATHFETTITKTIEPKDRPFIDPRDDSEPLFFELTNGPGTPIVVRDDLADPEKGRRHRRRSLFYFAQLTDFQLADEESPLRVEYTDPDASGGWRPHEAFHPYAIDQSFRRLNALAHRSPFTQGGNGGRAKMRLALLTGDQADNQQYNETLWIRQLVEPGSRLHPGSGIDDFSNCDPVARVALEQEDLEEEPNYVGVQDYEEFREHEDYWDPEEPRGDFINWPIYRGLMDRAQQPFTTTGLEVPTYVVNGNHDMLVQGNEDAIQAFDQIATGCFKATASDADPESNFPDPDTLLDLDPALGEFVPPDPKRRLVSRGEVRNIFSEGSQKDDHGFKFVDSQEDGDLATRGTAWYYAFSPSQEIRLIVIDTVSEGGVTGPSSEGNIDDPQFRWLERELMKASCIEEPPKCKPRLIVVTGHHPIRSLRFENPDELAGVCGGGYNNPEREYDGPDRETPPRPGHNHAENPGCDPDVRSSEPVHGGETRQDVEGLSELLLRFPHVIAYVPGHTHENCITAFEDGNGGGFWELNTSAVADWPQQNRIIDLMNNKDGTLSIFSAVTDHASNIGIPPPGKAGSFNREQLGAVGRTVANNDPQTPSETGFESPPCSEHTEEEREEFGATGRPEDRNVELVIRDPRKQEADQQATSDEEEAGSRDDQEEPELGEQVPPVGGDISLPVLD